MAASRTKQTEHLTMYVARTSHDHRVQFSWSDVEQMAAEFGLDPTDAAIMNLTNAGLIERIGTGRYRLTERGRRAATAFGTREWGRDLAT